MPVHDARLISSAGRDMKRSRFVEQARGAEQLVPDNRFSWLVLLPVGPMRSAIVFFSHC
jgi:hypothetical protein